MAEILVQTRLPERVAAWVARQADREGDTVAGWLRRLIIREQHGSRIAAWVSHAERADPGYIMSLGWAPHYVLAPVRDISATDRVFVLLKPNGTHVGPGGLRDTPAFERPAEHKFILNGSPTPWSIVTMMYSDSTKLTEITLRAELPEL